MATNWCIQKGVICDRVAASGYCAQSACTKVFQTGTARQTNADRIRAMSDEELADQLVIRIDGLEECRLYLSAPTGKLFIPRKEAVRVTLEWLRKPAEED